MSKLQFHHCMSE